MFSVITGSKIIYFSVRSRFLQGYAGFRPRLRKHPKFPDPWWSCQCFHMKRRTPFQSTQQNARVYGARIKLWWDRLRHNATFYVNETFTSLPPFAFPPSPSPFKFFFKWEIQTRKIKQNEENLNWFLNYLFVLLICFVPLYSWRPSLIIFHSFSSIQDMTRDLIIVSLNVTCSSTIMWMPSLPQVFTKCPELLTTKHQCPLLTLVLLICNWSSSFIIII